MSRKNYKSPLERFKKIVSVGLNRKTNVEVIGTHTSKSIKLPVVRAINRHSNVRIKRLADNFHFNFLGVELKKPVLATLLYPISGIFGSYPLSGNTDSSFSPITNFEKAYQNRDTLQRFGANSNDDVLTAMAIRYLHELSRLNPDRIMEVVMDNTRYGKRDVIDHNTIEYSDLAKAVGIESKDKREITYFDFDAGNLPLYFKKINVDWIDAYIDGSSLRVELAEEGVPVLTLPWKDLFVPTTEKQREAGLGKEVPARCLEYKSQREALNRREFTLNTPNPLDTALTFFYLTNVVAPVMESYSDTE